VTDVSVVIPAYNAADTLPETLESLIAQSFDDFEAIVVDDGSSDDTAEVAAASGDPRVRVLSVRNGGVARARNHGIAATNGTYVAFLDADDLWHPEKLELQVQALRADPAAGFCVTGATRIDAQSRELGGMPLRRPDDVCAALLLQSMVVGCLSSGLARRDALAQAGDFDPQFSQSADWDLWLRLAVSTRFLILDEVLVRYRTSPGNMSSNIGLLERDTFAVLDKFFASPDSSAYAGLRARAYSAHWLVCAGSYLHAGQRADAVRCLSRALRTHPASVTRPLGMPARWMRRNLAGARESSR
jgi:glycosyltransferase involved in cell wall biosynthesis